MFKTTIPIENDNLYSLLRCLKSKQRLEITETRKTRKV